MRRVSPLLGVAALLACPPATARELYSGPVQLSADGFYKTFGAGLRLPEGLGLPEDLGMSAHTVRVGGKLIRGDWLEVEAAWQVEGLVSSLPGMGAGAAGSLVPAGGGGQAAQRRFEDFDEALVEEGGLHVGHNLDRLSVTLALPFADLAVGRQALSWGAGRMWNPTDLLSPFSPSAVDKEVRRGVDALRLTLPLGDLTLLDVIWLPAQEAEDQSGVLRARTNLLEWDVSVTAARYVDDLVAGADLVGDVGELAVHGEAAYTWELPGLADGETAVADEFLRAAAGVDWMPVDDLMVMVEYHYNGFGAADPSGYLAKMVSPRVARGEVFGSGRHYVGLVAGYAASELLSVSGVVIANLGDPSALVMPGIEYWFEQSVILRAGGYIALGERPEGLALRSEYGAAPHGVYAQVGLYF